MPELQNGSTVEPVNAEFWLAVVFSHDLGAALGILSSPLRCQTIVRDFTFGQAEFFRGKDWWVQGQQQRDISGVHFKGKLGLCGSGAGWDVLAFVLLLKAVRAVPSQGFELLELPGCSGNNLKANATLLFDILPVWGMQWVSVQLAQCWTRTRFRVYLCKYWGTSVLWNAENYNISKYFS